MPITGSLAFNELLLRPRKVSQGLASTVALATIPRRPCPVTPTDDQLEEIAGYEMGVFTAQVFDWSADRLDRGGALGGARQQRPRAQ